MKQLSAILLSILCTSVIFGQTLTFEEVSSWEKDQKLDFTDYVASNGQVFKIGESFNIGTPETADAIFNNITVRALGNVMSVGMKWARKASEITGFNIKGSKRQGYYVQALGKNPVGGGKMLVEVELALKSGEIESTVMSRSEAIAKLKEAKDLLDLDMMTSDEYEALKKELEPIIRN
ncbi:MAG: hypothetical protein V7691_14580 [Galbibacter orientalis]|uniref:hypothetical protein n=1 Tax=Galbibacter orientalis TaxID=453852 RepID=UPI003000FE14